MGNTTVIGHTLNNAPAKNNNDLTLDRDLHQSTFLGDRTHHDLNLTSKMNKNNPENSCNFDPLHDHDEENNIGHTFENRHTIMCIDGTVSANTILSSQVNQPSFYDHQNTFSKLRVKPWVRPVQRGIKKNTNLASLKSGLGCGEICIVESIEESKYQSSQKSSRGGEYGKEEEDSLPREMQKEVFMLEPQEFKTKRRKTRKIRKVVKNVSKKNTLSQEDEVQLASRGNMPAGVTEEYQHTSNAIRASAQAGDIIDNDSTSLIKVMGFKKGKSKIKNQIKRRSDMQIDLGENSEISDILASSNNKSIKPQEKKNKITIDRIVPFEFGFEHLAANQTIDNNTDIKYVENEFKTGKARKLRDRIIELENSIDSPRQITRRNRTQDGVAVSTSSINVTGTENLQKAMPKHNKIRKLDQNL